jgi:hypothetical protein
LQNFDTIERYTAPVIALRPGAWDRRTFWQFATDAKSATESLAEQRMRALPHLSVDALLRFCTQYRFFTIQYISDLALLVAKLPFGGLRSLLSRILAEELGDGDPHRAHPESYDRFLASIGVPREMLHAPIPENRAILTELTDEMIERPAAFGVGLRGMGGECLCQTYLSVMFEHLQMHRYVREHADRIDWEFWTIHAGEEDILHGELTRKAIDDYLCESPDVLADLALGYERSITAWNRFWHNIFEDCARRGAQS